MKKKFFSSVLAIVIALSVSGFPIKATEMTEYSITDSESVRLLGRGEVSEDGSRTFNWSNAGFEFKFSGTSVEVYVTENAGTSYFNVQVDGGEPERVLINKTGWNEICTGLSNGDHTIKFVRSSAGTRGALKISKVRTDAEPEATEEKERKIEFIGDSYTTGYGNIHTDETWEASTATDAWYSYAGYAAREVDADYTLIAYAGRGVVTGYSGSTEHEMPYQFGLKEICCDWDAVKNMSTGEKQDFSEYQPQLVVIWLGTNDQAKGVSEANFEASYKELLEDVREAYPEALVLCLSKVSEGYPASIKNAINAMGGSDEGFYFRTLTTYAGTSMGHPSKTEAKVIGEELAGYIKELELLPGIEKDEEPQEPQVPEVPVESVDKRTIIYENDFSAPTIQEALATYSNEYVTFSGFTPNGDGTYTNNIEGGGLILGNGVIKHSNSNAWPNYRTLLFDFTKGGVIAGFNDGILKVGFDFSLRANNNSVPVANIGIGMKNQYDGGVMLGIGDKSIYTKNTISMYNADQNKVSLNLGQIYHLDIVMDPGTRKIAYYLDDVKLAGATTIPTAYLPIKNFVICLSGLYASFDNLLIEKWDEFEMKAKLESVTEDGAKVKFSDYIKDASELEGTMYYKNIYTGETILATASEVKGSSFVAAPEQPLVGGYEYELYLPENVTGLFSDEKAEGVLEFNFGGAGTIKSLKTKDFCGNLSKLKDKNPAELDGLVFEFDESLESSSYINSLVIFDEDGNEVEYTKKCTGNMAEITFTNALQGEKTYTISLDGLAVPYNIILNTTEGGVSFKSAKLYKEDGKTEIKSFSEISAGDKVKAVIEAVNTSDTEISYLATIGMYNGNAMMDIDFENVFLEAGNKAQTTVEFTVENKDELSFIGYMWEIDKALALGASVEITLK